MVNRAGGSGGGDYFLFRFQMSQELNMVSPELLVPGITRVERREEEQSV